MLDFLKIFFYSTEETLEILRHAQRIMKNDTYLPRVWGRTTRHTGVSEEKCAKLMDLYNKKKWPKKTAPRYNKNMRVQMHINSDATFFCKNHFCPHFFHVWGPNATPFVLQTGSEKKWRKPNFRHFSFWPK